MIWKIIGFLHVLIFSSSFAAAEDKQSQKQQPIITAERKWPADPIERLLVDIPDPEEFALKAGFDYGNCPDSVLRSVEQMDMFQNGFRAVAARDLNYRRDEFDAREAEKKCIVLITPIRKALTRREALAFRIVMDGHGAESVELKKIIEAEILEGRERELNPDPAVLEKIRNAIPAEVVVPPRKTIHKKTPISWYSCTNEIELLCSLK